MVTLLQSSCFSLSVSPTDRSLRVSRKHQARQHLQALQERRHALTACRLPETNESVGEHSSLAASQLKNGIVHFAIERVEEARRDEQQLNTEDVAYRWGLLVAAACKKDCGCAQALLQRVSLLTLELRFEALSASA